MKNSFRCLALSIISLIIGCHIGEAVKIDCHPLDGASKEKCEALGCVWSPVQQVKTIESGPILPFDEKDPAVLKISDGMSLKADIKEPWCSFPEEFYGYEVVGTSVQQVKLRRKRPSGINGDIQELNVDVSVFGGNLRLKIYDSNNKRYEPEIPKLRRDQGTIDESLFTWRMKDERFLQLLRSSTEAIIFSTDLSKLIFTDQFIQINTKLDSPFVYGLGEHYGPFLKKADGYKAFSFFNTDKVPLPDGRRSYGGFPFYINLDSDNMKYAHGVYLHNSNAMDVIIQPDNSITFRPIGGILDFIFFIGPTPNDVIKQFQHLVGLPNLPPRWSLGFQLCRYNYGSLEKTKLVWQRTRESGIPFDVQWNDIDYMERHNDFTYDHEKYAGLPEFVDKLHENKMHYMILFDPGLSQEDNYYPYTLGEQMNIFIKNSTNQTLIGKVWNDSGRTVFPDFSNENTTKYWEELFTKFHDELAFDGAWLDMNDISSFVDGSLNGCPGNNYLERAPYKPGGYDLQSHTLCLSAKHRAGSEYDLHNLYSFYETIATEQALKKAMPGKRPFIISRSTFPGQGHYGGHWSGDVLSNWDYLRWSIPSLIEYSMYGFSMMGSDICGFVGNTNSQLCARWSTLGAFYTFSRNHNDDVSIDQDPIALGPEVVKANKNAMTKRYSLLPYLYSLIHRAHKYGEPAVRSVPFEFYTTDKEALNVEYQFLWGGGLMISPVVEENSYTKKTYLPKGRWYETNVVPTEGDKFNAPKWIDSKGEWYETKNISQADIPLFYRGGHILPVYPVVRQTVAETVDQPIGLEIALCSKNMAFGEIYIDDGDNVDDKFNHVNMVFENNKLNIELDRDDYVDSVKFSQVKLFGISSAINEVKVNGRQISFERKDHMLLFDLESTSVSKNNNITVELH